MKPKINNLIWVLTNRGFGSEINNLLYAKNYTEKNNLNLIIVSYYWNFSIKNGLKDYFKTQENYYLRIKLLLFLFKNYYSPLTHCYNKVPLNKLVKEIYFRYIIKKKTSFNLNEALLTSAFISIKWILGIKSKIIFEVFKEVRDLNYSDKAKNEIFFNQKMNSFLNEFWNYQSDVYKSIQTKLISTGLEFRKAFAVFHVRRGDKVAETTMEDRIYHVKEYIDKLKEINEKITKIFIMSDDYNVYEEIKNKYPNYTFFTLLEPSSLGHDQSSFNKKDKMFRMNQAINLLSEVEIARKSSILIGSSGSNIFRMIEYLKLGNCHDLSNSNDI